jgi:hypothetical protein
MGAAVLPALSFFLTSIVYLLLFDIGLICGELRRVIGFDGGDSPSSRQAKNEGQIADDGAIFLPACFFD